VVHPAILAAAGTLVVPGGPGPLAKRATVGTGARRSVTGSVVCTGWSACLLVPSGKRRASEPDSSANERSGRDWVAHDLVQLCRQLGR